MGSGDRGLAAHGRPGDPRAHDTVIGCLRRGGFGLAETSTAVALLDARLSGFVDDVLDACAVAWTPPAAQPGCHGRCPTRPRVFSDGVAAAIQV